MPARVSMRDVPWRVAIPIALYLLLSLLGVSQSTIGIDPMRENPDHPEGVMWGQPQAIRTDEWRTSSPFIIGATASGTTEDINPLAAPQALLTGLPSGPVSGIVLADGTISTIDALPDEVLFAARWWLPYLLLALGAPAFFRNLTGSRHIGWFAAVLIACSPATAWWSGTPLAIAAVSIAGSAALQNAARRASDGRWFLAVLWGLLSAVVLARTCFTYAPWAVVLSTAIVTTASIAIVVDRASWARALAVVGGVGALTLGLCALILAENREELSVVSDTVYPGDRVATGYPVPFQLLFGATNELNLPEATGIAGTNQSEISSSFTVALIWALFLLTRRLEYRSSGHRAAVVSVALFAGFWMSWATVSWDRLGMKIPGANLVGANRAAQVVGMLAILLLCLVLPACRERGSVRVAAAAATASALVSASAGSLLIQQNAFPASTRSVWIAAALLAAVVFFISWRPRVPYGYVAAGLLAFALVVEVNPVLFGLGDLRDSDAAKMFLAAGEKSRESDTVWVSDSADVDSLMLATGVPALSGRQVAGPDVDAWRKLAPGKRAVWNRGGSYVVFQWTPDPKLQVTNPGDDVIVVAGSPCTVAKRVPGVEHVVASQPLDLDCLTEDGQFTWSGVPRWIYDVAPAQ
jgi:hypothetical protein